MSDPVWAWRDLTTAIAGVTDGDPPAGISGIAIDSRSIRPGELFVAIKDARDGHDFVAAAFKAGAGAALVRSGYQRQPGDGVLVRVDDPLRGLERLAAAARGRLAPTARVIAVTGSAGKTGTKEMLRAVLTPLGVTHAPEKSFNNHWGVPLTLARMPANTQYAVIEIGMNHAGEITPLALLARPHVAIITNVLPVHIGNFDDGETGVANAKAEIFAGLEAGCFAILPRDNPHFERLQHAAASQGARIVSFGRSPAADICVESAEPTAIGSRVVCRQGGTMTEFELGTAGEHIAINALSVVATLSALGLATGSALAPLATVTAPPGRGARRTLPIRKGQVLLIDESYNANPASMRAALAVLGAAVPDGKGRRIAVLGDMRELGALGADLHRELAAVVGPDRVDLLFACGPLMRNLFDSVAPATRRHWTEKSSDLVAPLLEVLADGDVVMVKGSLGTNMAPIVAALVQASMMARAKH